VQGSAADDAAALRLRLGEYLDPDDFTQGEVEEDGAYDSGVRMRRCKFTPVGGG
jgi:hypothetical protein